MTIWAINLTNVRDLKKKKILVQALSIATSREIYYTVTNLVYVSPLQLLGMPKL